MSADDTPQWKSSNDIQHCDGVEVTPYMHWWAHIHSAKGGEYRHCNLAQAACVRPPDAEKDCEELVPLPDFALAPVGTCPDVPKDLLKRTKKPPRNAVITGIIDEGIALGHARFRKMSGGNPIATRVLGAWQQGARYGGPDGTAAQPVPFGHVLLQSDIDALMQAHGKTGKLDEEAFNRASGLTDMSEPMGVATLERTVSHGTHVLDLAAGIDPTQVDAEDLDLRPILAVTLPRREAVGMSGTFLQFFVVHAMQWIVDMADALWEAYYPGEEGGFPVVLNLSFGQHAGPKNASSQIEQAFRALKQKRNPESPLYLVMPVGNDNLAKGNAYTSIATNSAKTKVQMNLPWRIQPEDYSTNFMELWVEMDGLQEVEDHPLILDVKLPGGQSVTGITGRHGHYLDLPGAARIYARKTVRCDPADPQQGVKQLYQYVICTSATMHETGACPVSPAGVWQITARWNRAGLSCSAGDEAKLYCTVQVDQAVEMGSLRNRRSYFDQQHYKTFDETGRLIDTFRYPLSGSDDDLLDGNSPDDLVQRRGTVNAIATDKDIVVVGGYRRSDGRPAPYSASSHSDERTPYGAAKHMTASLPTETAPAHFGLRAAGSKSSSMVNLRGTSFAAGLATRKLVESLLEMRKANGDCNYSALTAQAFAGVAAQSEAHSSFEGPSSPLKIGHGRMAADPVGGLDRLVWGGP